MSKLGSPSTDGSVGEPNLKSLHRNGLKRKRRGQESEEQVRAKAMRKSDSELPEESRINAAIAKMDGALLADYVARQLQRFEPELSLVELSDLRIPENAFGANDVWEGARTLQNLTSFLEKNTGKSSEKLSSTPSEEPGSPHTIFITCAGMRAADVTRKLRAYQTESTKIGKLFAKHIKLKDAVEFTKKTKMNIVVGTPHRMHDLAEQGVLSLRHVETVVIDGSHIDQKRRGIFEMRETLVPMLKLMALPVLEDDHNGDGGVGKGRAAARRMSARARILVF